jgi:TPR repeat protein
MSACSDLSSFYFLGTGGLEQSHEKGIELLSRACHHGQTGSCFILGLRYRKGISVPPSESKALEYLKLACDGGDKMACAQMVKGQSAAVLLP